MTGSCKGPLRDISAVNFVQYFQAIINTHSLTIMNSKEFRLLKKKTDLTAVNSKTEKKITALVVFNFKCLLRISLY